MRRLLALIVAVGLVLGAVAIRGGFDSTGSSDPKVSSSSLTLICAPEVADACRQVGAKSVTVEAPGVTADRLSKDQGQLGADLWVAPDVWMDLVAARVPDSPALPKRSAALGSASLVLVANTRTNGATLALCPNGIDWACVTKPQVAASLDFDESSSTAGLLTATAITAGLLGQPTFSANDFKDNETFADGLSNFEAALPNKGSGRTALSRLLTLGVPGATTALSSTATSDPAVRTKQLTVLIPAPSLSVSVRAAGTITSIGKLDTTALKSALLRDGWLATSASDDRPGLPKSGVIVALLDQWNTTIGQR